MRARATAAAVLILLSIVGYMTYCAIEMCSQMLNRIQYVEEPHE